MTFFTVAGIDDEAFPPEHPDVVRFHDRHSAEGMMKAFQDKGLLPATCYVAEHTRVDPRIVDLEAENARLATRVNELISITAMDH